MKYIAGVDIGNNTTEVAIAEYEHNQATRIVSSSIVRTVGIKGTLSNVFGIIDGLDRALNQLSVNRESLEIIYLNEATPVIGDVAMETITETVITESAMIGHNPSTPGGMGLGIGYTISIDRLHLASSNKKWIVVISDDFEFQKAAAVINQLHDNSLKITGAIVKKDDGVLIHNRLKRPIPIVDEVHYIEKIPMDMLAAVEVAPVGKAIENLSNPYNIATLFDLNPEETRNTVPIARALTGNRSAVVIKTPKGDISQRCIPAGEIKLIGEKQSADVFVEEGADAIMEELKRIYPLSEVRGEQGTNVGGMFESVRKVMADLTDQPINEIRIQDILAVDTLVPQQVIGSLAGEYSMGNAVGISAMVKTNKLPMQRLARKLTEEISVPVFVGGVEAEMAIKGALTTPGTQPPMATLDLGGGSTDASMIKESGEIISTHLAGAGDMVTLLIDKELGLEDPGLAEQIKFFNLAKVESLFHLRHENGSIQFFNEPLDPRLFGRVAIITDEGPVALEIREPMEKIVAIRQGAKKKVFVKNSLRALKRIAPANNIRLIGFVVLVGGSALDFEIPKMISDVLIEYGVVTGQANIRGLEGPRNAVATGLILANKKRGLKID